MRVDTFTKLKAAITRLVLFAGDLDGTDFDTEAMIQMCEADLKRRLRHPRMLTRSTATLDTRTFALPSAWLQTLRFGLTAPANAIRALEPMSVNELMDRRAASNDAADIPYGYAQMGLEFEVWPTPSGSFTCELIHYAFPTGLSGTNASNWILSEMPDLYLYGSLIMGELFNQSDERLPVWTSKYEQALADANRTGEIARTSGSGLRVRFR